MSRRRSQPKRPTPGERTASAGHVLSLRKKIAFSILVVVGVFAFLEFGLRVARVGEPPAVGVMRFGYDTGIPIFDSDGIEREGEPFQDFPLFEADLLLFWKPIANTPFTGDEGLRLPAPESKEKEPGVYRIGIIGDSCSFLGEEVYPSRFVRLAEEATGRKIEVVNASCPGYTSLQGRRRLRDVWPWDPDLIVVYAGWNDHWKSLNGQTDRELIERQLLSDKAKSWMGKSRLMWSLYSLRVKLAPPVPTNQSPVRVPPNDYRENLRQILGEAEQRGCKVVFITAPTAFQEGQMPPWAFDFFGQIYQMPPEDVLRIPQTHEKYNDIVREIAGSSSSALLLDVAKEWSEPSQVERHIELFRGDRIHLTERGHQEIAEQLFDLWKKIP